MDFHERVFLILQIYTIRGRINKKEKKVRMCFGDFYKPTKRIKIQTYNDLRGYWLNFESRFTIIENFMDILSTNFSSRIK